MATWDDHEIANNGYRDGFSGLNNTEDSFLNDGLGISVDTRKVHAVRTYWEWMYVALTPIVCGIKITDDVAKGRSAKLTWTTT